MLYIDENTKTLYIPKIVPRPIEYWDDLELELVHQITKEVYYTYFNEVEAEDGRSNSYYKMYNDMEAGVIEELQQLPAGQYDYKVNNQHTGECYARGIMQIGNYAVNSNGTAYDATIKDYNTEKRITQYDPE